MKPALLRPAAAAEVEQAWRWYEAQRDGLGDEFLETLRAALLAIELDPEAAPVVHRDIRCPLRKRFPFVLFYRVIEDQTVVLACFHATLQPRRWTADLSPRRTA